MVSRRSTIISGIAVVIALVALTSFTGSLAASATPQATVHLGQTASISGTPANALTVAAGTSMTVSLNYTCSGADCLNTIISIPIPAGLQFGAVTPSSDVASSSSSGNTVTVVMNPTLAAGSSGQISLPVTVPGGTTPDGSTFSWQSTIAATNAVTASSPSIDILSHAGNTTSVSVGLNSGGAVGAPTTYGFSSCVSGSGVTGYGPLAIAAGNVLVAQLPAGAVYVSSSNGGVYDSVGGTVTWTQGQQGGCAGQTVVVTYPASDPSNVTGASKTVSASWQGSDYSSVAVRLLGTNSFTSQLVAPVVGVTFNKWSYTTSIPLDAGGMTYFLSVGNTGNQTLDSVTIDDSIPDAMQVTNVGFNNISGTPGEIWIASENGRDGIAGNTDDGVLVKAADVPANTNFNFNPYATWQDTLPGLASSDLVTEVVIKMFALPPGTGGDLGSISATPLHTGRSGTTTHVGDTITNTANFAYTSGTTSGNVNKSASLTIAQQIPTADVRLGGPGTLGFGVTQGTFNVTGSVNTFDLPDPVFALVLPAKVNYVSFTHDTSPLPEPTLTTISNWQGNGSTLLRWTFPSGTVLAKNTSYQIHVVTSLATGAWGTLTASDYMSSTSIVPNCVFNFFGSGPDTQDIDGDGNTTEVPCKWSDSISPAPSTSANVTSSASGAYDSGFVTGTSYTAPGSNDSLRVALNNTGTVQLNHGIIVEVLPRPGDTNVLSSATRNPSSQTFPVILRGTPIVPTLTSAVTTSYSTVTNPCKPELSYSPSGCAAPNWSTTPPSNLASVTAIKVDFGTNVIDPFTSWTVTFPVTTPTSGASEPDFASSNASAILTADDEIAYNSAAFVASNISSGSALLPSESTPLAIRVPSIAGQRGAAPSPSALTSTGVGTATQTASPTVPTLGSAALIDALGQLVTAVSITGEGTYSIDATTGVISFAPVAGFVGPVTPVSYRITDAFAQTGDSTYTPTVTAPALAAPAALTSTGTGTAQQTATISVPALGSSTLLDSGGQPVTSLSVPGVGDYSVDPATGAITFQPAVGFLGAAPPVAYRVNDSYGQHADSTYIPTVTLPAGPTASAVTTSGLGTAPEQVTVSTVPAGGHLSLLGGSSASSLTLAGKGTWTVSGNVLTFTPVAGYTGVTPSVDYVVHDAYSQTAQSTAVATVATPAPPVASALTSTPPAGARGQSVSFPLPTGAIAMLIDGTGAPVTSLVIPGEGTYTINIAHGPSGDSAVIAFLAEPGFAGLPTLAAYEVSDAYGQTATSTYRPGAYDYAASSSSLASTGSDPTGSLLLVVVLLLVGFVLVTPRRVVAR
jgi:CshA-type fibril repeat protein